MRMARRKCHYVHRSTCFLSIATGALTVLLGANSCFAFQTSGIIPRSISSARTETSPVVCEMVASSYPNRVGETSSFLAPIFQDYQQWPRSTRSQSGGRGLLSTSSLIFSSRGGRFSFLETSSLDDDEDDESLLQYLPLGGADLTPKTRELLKRVTSEYVSGRGPVVQVDEVLDVIDEEYKSRDVPVIVGHDTFDFASSGEVDDADVARILSFAAFHRLPHDVALLLFGPTDNDGDQGSAFVRCQNELARGSWKEVSFPRGLAIRPKRKFVKSSTKRYMPMPRTWMTSRKDAVQKAQLAVNVATHAQAPPRRRLSREEFLASMDKELSATEPTELLPSLFREARLFFPRQNLKLKRLRKVFKKQIALLKDAGMAGLISYVTLNFAWYTIAIVSQWRHTTPTVEISSRALGTALRRFGKVLAGAYIGSQLTRMLRLKIALVLSPFGNRALRLTQKRLRISETKAFALLSGVILGTCLAVWSIIVLGDAAVLRTAGALHFDQVGFESSI